MTLVKRRNRCTAPRHRSLVCFIGVNDSKNRNFVVFFRRFIFLYFFRTFSRSLNYCHCVRRRMEASRWLRHIWFTIRRCHLWRIGRTDKYRRHPISSRVPSTYFAPTPRRVVLTFHFRFAIVTARPRPDRNDINHRRPTTPRSAHD